MEKTLIEKIEMKSGLVDDYPGNYESCQRCFEPTLKDILKEHKAIKLTHPITGKTAYIKVCPKCHTVFDKIFRK